MMHTDPPDIDPDSQALQYRIEDVDGTWVLVREYPEMPRTPAETLALEYLQELLVTDGSGHWIVPDAARPHLDAEPGDVVSIIAVGNADCADAKQLDGKKDMVSAEGAQREYCPECERRSVHYVKAITGESGGTAAKKYCTHCEHERVEYTVPKEDNNV